MARPMTDAKRDAPAVDDLPASQRARRDRIVDTAVEMLATDDNEKIHMRLVAARSGVALGTLYRYFPSKERLFATALIRWGQTFEQSRLRGLHFYAFLLAQERVTRARATSFRKSVSSMRAPRACTCAGTPRPWKPPCSTCSTTRSSTRATPYA